MPTGCNARSLTFTCYPNRASLAQFKGAFIRAIEEHRDGTKLLPRWLAIPAIRLRKGGEDLFFRNAAGMVISFSPFNLMQRKQTERNCPGTAER